MAKKHLQKRKKMQLDPLDNVYEPFLDEIPIRCFFTNDLHLVCRSYIDKKLKENTNFNILRLGSDITVRISLLVLRTNLLSTLKDALL